MQTQVLPGYHSGFPGFRHEVLDVVDAGDRAVLRLRVTMEHTGPFPTPQGDIPATGRTVVLESCDVVTASNGALTSWHTYFDQLSMLAPAGPAAGADHELRGATMSGQELVSRFAAAFEAGDAAGLGSLYAEDATFDHPFFGHITGRDVIVAHETPMFDAFTEISIAVHSVSQDGNKVAWEWTVDATHTGAMPLPDGGVVQPTGIRISQPGVDGGLPGRRRPDHRGPPLPGRGGLPGAARPGVSAVDAALVLPLTAVGGSGASAVGGKAAWLGALLRADLPVPDGVVLRADAPADAALDALDAARERLGGRVAVRSSAADEDLATGSAAGRYLTVLDVTDRAALAAAVAACRASGGAQGAGMAVVVQAQVAADMTGVAFTADPVTGDRDVVVVVAGTPARSRKAAPVGSGASAPPHAAPRARVHRARRRAGGRVARTSTPRRVLVRRTPRPANPGAA